MAKMNVPESPRLYNTQYENLLGADFSCDPTECSKRRSPDCLNMISDNGGNPVKRLGWRTKYNINSGKILKLYIDGDITYAMATDGIYRVKDGASKKIIDKPIDKADIVKYQDKVYAFANGLYEISGDKLVDMMEDPYVPEVVISRLPNGTAGTFLESVNLFTPKRKISFLGNETDKQYNFVPANDMTEDQYKYVIADSIKVEVQDDKGVFKETTEFTKPATETVKGKAVDGSIKDFVVCAPYITFSAPHKPPIAGQDNVRVTYETFDATLEDNVMKGQYKELRQKILNSGIVKTHGYIAADRIFAVVDDTKIYFSDINEPAYFPDDNYITVGNDGRIVGLHRVARYLVAIKNDISTESTIYIISGEVFDDKTVFSVIPAIGGTGAISGESFGTLLDEPLFLSKTGIYAITNTLTTTEKVLKNRSTYLDKKLCKEPNLQNAVATVWNRYYILSVNGHGYILDGRKKSSDRNRNTDYAYEGYYWENINATCFFTHDNELWFGTADGKINKFNTDIEDITAYCDDGKEYQDNEGITLLKDGVAIPCYWKTPLDNDGAPQYYKTLNKKGTLVTLIPYDRSSVTVYLSKDGDSPVMIGYTPVDVFNWKVIDFSRFTFNANTAAQDVFLKKKVKKYKRLQMIFENNAIYEPFGIINIVKTYTVGNFAKR